MRKFLLALTFSTISWAGTDPGCAPVSFLSARSATLQPAPGVQRILLKESDGSYSAFELSRTSPYHVIRKIPHFEKQLSACAPAGTGLDQTRIQAVAQLKSGGYIFAIQSETGGGIDIAVFDSQLQLSSEAPFNDLLLPPVVFADVNGDGNLDLIGVTVETAHEQYVSLALGHGTANFDPPVPYPVAGGATSISAIAIADVNGDHKPDIVVTELMFNGVYLLAGNGDGTFQTAKSIVSANEPAFVTIADLNGDGKPDLILNDVNVNSAEPIIAVALGHGDGTFATPVNYPANGDTNTIADVNGDGIPDIVTNGVTILFGDGAGAFPKRRDYPGTSYATPIVTDFDGDGIADIVLGIGNPAIIAGDNVTAFHGLGKGDFESSPVTYAPDDYDSLATADVNGDGIPDLVSVQIFGKVSVLLGAGDGTFRSSFQFTVTTGLPYAAVFGDFNGDGKPDLAVVSSGYTPGTAGELDILLGNGDGTFQAPTSTALPIGAFNLGVGDFNHDGTLDVAALVSQQGGGVSDSVVIVLGKGDGTFTSGATYPVGPNAVSLAIGDFNGDGNPDIVVADAGTNANQSRDGNIAILLGKGEGTFDVPVKIPVKRGSQRWSRQYCASRFQRRRQIRSGSRSARQR